MHPRRRSHSPRPTPRTFPSLQRDARCRTRWNAPGRTTERRSPNRPKARPRRSNSRRFTSGLPPSFIGVRLCRSYTQEVVMGRMLSTRERSIMNTTTTAPECQTLDINDAATALGVCKATVRRLVRRQVLRKLPMLRRILIPKAEVHRYLDTGEGGVSLKTLSKRGPEVAQKNPYLRKYGGPTRI